MCDCQNKRVVKIESSCEPRVAPPACNGSTVSGALLGATLGGAILGPAGAIIGGLLGGAVGAGSCEAKGS